jgi:hypothetical protein
VLWQTTVGLLSVSHEVHPSSFIAAIAFLALETAGFVTG